MQAVTHSVQESFRQLRREKKARHRDIAEMLKISEAELVAAHVGLSPDDSHSILHATRLRFEWPQILASLEPLGQVMALTRNSACVHEKTGVYRNVSQHQSVGLVLGDRIDLRVFYRHWAHGFALQEQTEHGLQRSLQFFSAEGVAVHKVFLPASASNGAYTDLQNRFADSHQSNQIDVAMPQKRAIELADAEIDVAGFQCAWDAMQDTHDFSGLLDAFGIHRTQALRLAGHPRANTVKVGECQILLQSAAAAGLPIMVFVGNPGMLQIHTGPVIQVSHSGPWLNVTDPGFNLHLRTDLIASAWMVTKPTLDGPVSSLELFDSEGSTIAMFFGERKPGRRELPNWRGLLESLQPEPGQ